MKGHLAPILGLLLGSCLLSACGSLECTFNKNDLEFAATINHVGGGYYPLPHDAWTINPRLEGFLRNALKTEGFDSLTTKYGMQCVASRRDAGCQDCFTCRKSVKEWTLGSMALLPGFKCVDWGEVLVQADLGPGSSLKAVTYWRTTPDAREYLAGRPRQPPPDLAPFPPPRTPPQ
jgi:hypothetical protein